MAGQTKTRKPKAADDDAHDDDDDAGSSSSGGGGDDHGGGRAPESDAELVDRVVDKVLEALRGRGADDDGGGDDGGGDDGGAARPRDDEAAMEDRVRRAMDRLRRDELVDEKLHKLETTITEKVREAAPKSYRRLTRIMWGGDD